MFGVCGSDFQAFSCSISGTQWHMCFFSESGKSCNHGFNSWDLEEGKKQTSVLARLRIQAALSAPLPDSSRGGGESPLPSLVQTSNLSCSHLIYYLLISIQPRRCSLGQRRREVSQSWSWSSRLLAVSVSFPRYAPRGQDASVPLGLCRLPVNSFSADSCGPAEAGRGHTGTAACPARPEWGVQPPWPRLRLPPGTAGPCLRLSVP